MDAEQARGIAHNILMDSVDWVAMLTQAVLDGEEIEVPDVSGAEGKAALFGR